ncbi:MAG: maleylpyruvate isomerase family mycothiol-dependent enzyme [Propionibacteriaceae bacterium]|jgi:maleylpyruvate isomerase|nr:maleylpyruvate isomerase family mycothiol-dependent enzyme [Propionibacteriaceae bacterium]
MGTLAIDDLDDLRLDLTVATQRLLGDTMTLSDEDWFEPTGLPGWMRSHVATHLTQQASATERMVRQLDSPEKCLPWCACGSSASVMHGASRSGLELLEDLDRSAASLMNAFDAMASHAWDHSLLTSQGVLPAKALALVRLNELILHHVDLRVGPTLADIEPRVAEILLAWNLFRAEPRFTQVRLHVSSDSGNEFTIGTGVDTSISGSTTFLLGWITGRMDSTAVLGAEGLNLGAPV